MFLCNQVEKNKYIRSGDPIREMLATASTPGSNFVSHRWLLESLEKRIIYRHVYGDLLDDKNKKILDVGGGFCSLSYKLLEQHEYYLLDIMAHDDLKMFTEINSNQEKSFWINSDWNTFDLTENYDIVIANDLFPNVDQRVELFLEKFLPHCNEMRLSLTYYDNKVYKVKRTDGDEIFHMLAWDSLRLLRSLKKYKTIIKDYDPKILLEDSVSIFPNGRHVCVLKISGFQK